MLIFCVFRRIIQFLVDILSQSLKLMQVHFHKKTTLRVVKYL